MVQSMADMDVTISIPQAIIPRLTAAMRTAFPQHAALTDLQAFKAITGNYWKTVLVEHEKQIASMTYDNEKRDAITIARDAAIADSAFII